MAGTGKGRNDLPFFYLLADIQTGTRFGVGIKRYEPCGVASGFFMFNDKRVAEIIFENCLDHAILQ